jgi:hypothetical protein
VPTPPAGATPLGGASGGLPPGGAVLTWVGFGIAIGLAAVSSVWEAFLTPLAAHWTSGGHSHSVRLPLALVLAVGGNFALAWFTRTVTGRGAYILGPFLVWTALMVVAASETTEGDLVLTSNNWVGITTMFAGALAYAAAGYWLAMRSLPRRYPPPSGAGGR